jgi:hypothetical protein
MGNFCMGNFARAILHDIADFADQYSTSSDLFHVAPTQEVNRLTGYPLKYFGIWWS